MHEKTTRRAGRIRDAALVVFFSIFLTLPGLDNLLGVLPTRELVEKRELAPRPHLCLTLESVRAFPREFEDFFNDRFGGRSLLARTANRIAVTLLGVSPVEHVLLGKEGWLFLGDADTLVTYRWDRPYPAPQLDALHSYFDSVASWCRRRRIRLLCLVVPNKCSVYPEYMPDYVARSPGTPRLTQFLDACEQSAIPVLDLREALTAAKRRGPVYWRLDTHWNPAGAYTGYRECMDRLAAWFPGLSRLRQAEGTAGAGISRQMLIEHGLLDAGHDLAQLLGLQDILARDNDNPAWPGPAQASPLRVWILELSPGFARLRTESTRLPRAFLLMDSFGMELIPFLASSFSELTVSWSREFDTAVILDSRPDVILFESAERFLLNDRPFWRIPPALD